MLALAGKKIAFTLGVWLAASVLIFAVLRVLPADAAQVIAGLNGTPEQVAKIRSQLRLDAPLTQQYWEWVSGVFRGDLGTSLLTGAPLQTELGPAFSVTAVLALLGLGLAVVFAVPLGIYTGLQQQRRLVRSFSYVFASLAGAAPVWLGIILITVFSHWLRIFPPGTFPEEGWADPLPAFAALLLPAFLIALLEGAVLLRYVINATVNATRLPAVVAGMSYGHGFAQAVLRYGLPQTMLALTSTLTVQLASLLTGTVVVEKLFQLPGAGSLLLTAVANRDLPLVATLVWLGTGLVLLLGMMLDIAVAVLDPRLREKRGHG